MGIMLKFVLHMAANLLWKRIGGSGAIPPVRLPKGKRPVNIPVASPWQTYIVTWMARKMWSSVGGQVKDVMAASPNGAVQKVGSWLPNAPAKAKSGKPTPPKAPVAPAPRKPHVWDAGAHTAPAPRPTPQPPAPQPQAAPQAPASAPRTAPNYATRRLDDQSQPAAQAPAAPSVAPSTPAPSAPPARPGSLLSSLRKRS